MYQQAYNEQTSVCLYVRSRAVVLNCCVAGKVVLHAQKSYLVPRSSGIVGSKHKVATLLRCGEGPLERTLRSG
jgi:hypothetical protein